MIRQGAHFACAPPVIVRASIHTAGFFLEGQGGFDQYYFNSSSDHARLAPSAPRTIGACKAAAIVEHGQLRREIGSDQRLNPSVTSAASASSPVSRSESLSVK